ncbi:hypothetical protein [Thalassobaculum salexigens]|uniref:hypothetical protein n=1 Tax=Thalassobaculum salexigens TaxID=455360 RepID=UPI0003FC5BC4|nr:hypothetical protein [Thalassobaculum salexigens]
MSMRHEGWPGPSSGLGSRHFDLKLRLIMRTLGTGSQKELGSLLQEINPQTGFLPSRAYKWVTGRALPRDQSIFDDLAQLLGLEADGGPAGGEWLRTVDFAGFRSAMIARYGTRAGQDADPDRGAPLQSETIRRSGVPDAGVQAIPRFVHGSYLVVSPAWSAYRHDQFVVGEIVIGEGDRGTVMMQYRERLPGGDVVMRGLVWRLGQCLHATITEPEGEHVMSMVFAVPVPPGVALAGLMSGTPVHDAETRMVSGRFIALDLPQLRGADPAAAEPGEGDLEGYCEASVAGVERLLEMAGATVGNRTLLAAGICAYLGETAGDGLIDVRQAAVNDLVGHLIG